jgi:hypothetical protein
MFPAKVSAAVVLWGVALVAVAGVVYWQVWGGKGKALYAALPPRAPQAGAAVGCPSGGATVATQPPGIQASIHAEALSRQGWVRDIINQQFVPTAAQQLPAPAATSERMAPRDDFQQRARIAAAQETAVTPISLSWNQFVTTETAATRTFPLYTSKNVDPFLTPYTMIQANSVPSNQAYFEAQTFGGNAI